MDNRVDSRIIAESLEKLQATGETFSDEDHASGKDFCMKIVVVGYEETSRSKKGETVQQKTPSTKIRSWVGLWMETLKTCEDCENIHQRYFLEKRQPKRKDRMNEGCLRHGQ